MISQKKTLLVFNVDNVVDIITNSSSELFVLKGQTKEIVEEMISDVYPDYLNEYHPVTSLRDAEEEDISTYYNWIEDSWFGIWDATHSMEAEEKRKYEVNHYIKQAEKYGMTPEEFYDKWNPEDKWFNPDPSSSGLRKIAETLDPDGKIFLLFSIDENPDWDMQEKLTEIGYRYHLG